MYLTLYITIVLVAVFLIGRASRADRQKRRRRMEKMSLTERRLEREEAAD